jgi:uncharacterized membrane-anchored protein
MPVLFAVLISLFALAYWHRSLPSVLAFWAAYVLTRPLGASIADWTGKGHNLGGMSWGDGHVGLALTVLIMGFVAYFTLRDRRFSTGRGERATEKA